MPRSTAKTSGRQLSRRGVELPEQTITKVQDSYKYLEKARLKDSTEAQEQQKEGNYCPGGNNKPPMLSEGLRQQKPSQEEEEPSWVQVGDTPKVLENKQAQILQDFQIQTDKMVVANEPDIVVVDKHEETVVVIDVAIPNDSNIRKKEHEKLEKYQGLKEEMERMWGMKATVVPVVIGTLGAVTPNLSRWLQQIPGTTSEISVQKSAVLGTAKILRRTLRLPGLW
ncbi:hypothetical protein D4764_18G0000570 [Takifugu flavidus]|uniref:Uncharacterized protein n=1 Tax=Takifugu flavidus TaxID=433684 RepID=A0A5C6NRK5_9TELE|nr:hypothetical protein D4764_18G0000570 [Takifugu flavidus]